MKPPDVIYLLPQDAIMIASDVPAEGRIKYRRVESESSGERNGKMIRLLEAADELHNAVSLFVDEAAQRGSVSTKMLINALNNYREKRSLDWEVGDERSKPQSG